MPRLSRRTSAGEAQRRAAGRQLGAGDHGGERVEDVVLRLLDRLRPAARGPPAALMYVLSALITGLGRGLRDKARSRHGKACGRRGNAEHAASIHPVLRSGPVRHRQSTSFLHLDAGVFDHLRPLRDFIAQELLELGG